MSAALGVRVGAQFAFHSFGSQQPSSDINTTDKRQGCLNCSEMFLAAMLICNVV